MLRRLNLAHNPNLSELRDTGMLSNLTSLDASHCNIDSLRGLSEV